MKGIIKKYKLLYPAC